MSEVEFFPCHACGKMTHIDDLDGKPEPGSGLFRAIWLWWTGRSTAAWDDPEGSADWTRLECGKCYGPGYTSNRGHADDGNSYRYHATGLPAGGNA